MTFKKICNYKLDNWTANDYDHLELVFLFNGKDLESWLLVIHRWI